MSIAEQISLAIAEGLFISVMIVLGAGLVIFSIPELFALAKKYRNYRRVKQMIVDNQIVIFQTRLIEKGRERYGATMDRQELYDKTKLVIPYFLPQITSPLAVRTLIWKVATDHRNRYWINKYFTKE